MKKQVKQIPVPTNREEFIAFFGKISEKKWCVGAFDGAGGTHCAVGHVKSYIKTEFKKNELDPENWVEVNKVKSKFEKNFKKAYKHQLHDLIQVNDNGHSTYNSRKLKVKGPKKRVMAFLRKVK